MQQPIGSNCWFDQQAGSLQSTARCQPCLHPDQAPCRSAYRGSLVIQVIDNRLRSRDAGDDHSPCCSTTQAETTASFSVECDSLRGTCVQCARVYLVSAARPHSHIGCMSVLKSAVNARQWVGFAASNGRFPTLRHLRRKPPPCLQTVISRQAPGPG